MAGLRSLAMGGMAKVGDLYCKCSNGVDGQVEVVLPFLWRSNVDLVGVAGIIMLRLLPVSGL